MTHYLRFPDEPTGMAALEAEGFLNDDGEVITASHTHAIDVIGLIYVYGEWDPETGEVITPPELLPGWHVNYVGDLPDGWEAYVVSPRRPKRVFC
jgi:hypothetical protein